MIDFKIDKTWTLFLDRDGVINQRIVDDYVKSTEEFKFTKGWKKSFQIFNANFKYIFVVTNQQGIAKGLMSHADLEAVHHHLCDQVKSIGGRITQIYYAPQLKDKKSIFRKPNIGMGLLAYRDFENIDFSKSIMVGDSQSDIDFGNRLGMKTISIGIELQDSHAHFDSLIDFANKLDIT